LISRLLVCRHRSGVATIFDRSRVAQRDPPNWKTRIARLPERASTVATTRHSKGVLKLASDEATMQKRRPQTRFILTMTRAPTAPENFQTRLLQLVPAGAKRGIPRFVQAETTHYNYSQISAHATRLLVMSVSHRRRHTLFGGRRLASAARRAKSGAGCSGSARFSRRLLPQHHDLALRSGSRAAPRASIPRRGRRRPDAAAGARRRGARCSRRM